MNEKIFDRRPLLPNSISSTPLISVLIANYNYANYIGRAIESVLKQSYQHFEIVICDDGSKDRSLEVIHKYSTDDQRIKVIAKENGGQASALNTAFRYSQGDIIAILDADDAWFPDKLQKVKDTFLANPQVGFVYHQLRIVDGLGRHIRDFPKKRALVNGWLLPKLQNHWTDVVAPASALSLHRSVAEEVFPLPETFRSLADAIIISRSTVLAICKAIPETLGIWQQHNQNLTGYGMITLEALEKYLAVQRKVLKDKESFVKKHYSDFRVNYDLWESEALGLMICVYYLFSGNRPSLSDLRRYRSGLRLLVWNILFNLPRPLAVRIHRFWMKNIKLHSLFSQV